MGPIYDADSFTDIELSEQSQELLTQNSKSGETLVRLNRSLLADAYPYELTSLVKKHTAEDSKGIEKCRENLRQIQLAREKYSDDTNKDPQWLSELAPEYLEKKNAPLSCGCNKRQTRSFNRRCGGSDATVQLPLRISSFSEIDPRNYIGKPRGYVTHRWNDPQWDYTGCPIYIFSPVL